jgi:hypothetical protein
MASREAIRIEVEVEPGSEPISGQFRPSTGPSRPFAGWLDLVAAIEHERWAGSEGESGEREAQ